MNNDILSKLANTDKRSKKIKQESDEGNFYPTGVVTHIYRGTRAELDSVENPLTQKRHGKTSYIRCVQQQQRQQQLDSVENPLTQKRHGKTSYTRCVQQQQRQQHNPSEKLMSNKQLQTIQKENTDLQEQIENLKKQLEASTDKEEKKLDKQRKNIKKNNNNLEVCTQTSSKNILIDKKKYVMVLEEMESLKKEAHALQEQVKNLTSQLEASKGKVNQLNASLKAEKELDKQQEVESLKKEVNEANKKYNDAIVLTKKYKKKIDDFRKKEMKLEKKEMQAVGISCTLEPVTSSALTDSIKTEPREASISSTMMTSSAECRYLANITPEKIMGNSFIDLTEDNTAKEPEKKRQKIGQE